MKNVLKTIINVILTITGIITTLATIATGLTVPIFLILFAGKIFGLLSITWFIVLLPIIISVGIWLLLGIIWLIAAIINN